MTIAQPRPIELTACPVVSHERINARYRLLVLRSQSIADAARPGQFIMLRTSDGRDPLLSRPFAIFDADPDHGVFSVLYIVVGRGTRLLEQRSDGELFVAGPLGRGFKFFNDASRHIAIGGGSGLAAVYSFVKRKSGLKPTDSLEFIIGARDSDGLLPADMTAPLRVPIALSTDDGSTGFKGTAIDLLEKTLGDAPSGSTPALYVAGPEPMMRAAARFAKERNIRCAVSLGNRMACGFGVCRGCVCKSKSPDPISGLQNKSVCADGPVFDIRDIDFE